MKHFLKLVVFFSILMFLPLVTAAENNKQLKPFSSDGCSAFPDGTLKQKKLWLACCTAHDLAYWQGGTKKQRKTADKKLAACVAKVGKPKIAKLMLAGVRVGGSPYWPTTFRWGYGWPWPKEYGPLTTEEKQQVSEKLNQYHASLSGNKKHH